MLTSETFPFLIHPSVVPCHRCDACTEEWPLKGQLISGVTGSGGGGAASKEWLPDGYSQIIRLYVFGPLRLKDYGSAATLQNWITSFPWIVPPPLQPWRNARKGRDQILPPGNLARRPSKGSRAPTTTLTDGPRRRRP